LNIRLIWSRCGIKSDRSTEWVSAIRSAPISPLLNEEASSRAPVAAEFGQLRGGALAAKQVTAKLGFQLLDRPRQRGLRDVALVGGAREVQHARNREKIANLMHLHGRAPVCPGRTVADRFPR
jgi:hypothetical protein